MPIFVPIFLRDEQDITHTTNRRENHSTDLNFLFERINRPRLEFFLVPSKSFVFLKRLCSLKYLFKISL